MKLRDLVTKLKNTTSPLARDQSVPDDVTTDKELKSLRRQYRVQQEVHEKEYLRKVITEEQRKQSAKALNDGISPLKHNGVGFKLKKPSQTRYYGRGGLL